MFGYASTETAELMPLPITLAHRLCPRLTEVRKDGTLPYLRPDGKTQVTRALRLDEHGRHAGRDRARPISTQHRESVDVETIKPDLIEHVIDPVLRRPRAPARRRAHAGATSCTSTRPAAS